MARLALVRHGESLWNAKNLWTGWTDISLSEKGKIEAQKAAEKLKDTHWDVAFVSSLKRSRETLTEIERVLGYHINTISDAALNERNYGIYTGKDKLQIEKEMGQEKYLAIRRGWDTPVPHGETLKDVYARVVPYFQKTILPELQNGKNVLIPAHGNSLRALAKYLQNLSDEEISGLEIPTGAILQADCTWQSAPPYPCRQI